MCRKILAVVAVAVAGWLAVSCRHSDGRLERYLTEAERILDTAPDSTVCSILHDSIDTPLLNGASEMQQGRYWLLLARMCHELPVKGMKWFYISAALNYLEGQDVSDDYVRALLLQSEMERREGDPTHAILTAMRACRAAEELDDDYLRAKTAEEMAAVFRASCRADEALRYMREAVAVYKEKSIDDEYALALSRMAYDCVRLNCMDDAAAILKSLGEKENITPELKIGMALAALELYSATEDFGKAEACGDTLLKYSDKVTDIPALYATIAGVKLGVGKTDEAAEMVGRISRVMATDRDSLSFYLASAKLRKIAGDLTGAISDEENADRMYERIYNDVLRHSVVSMQKNFYEDEAAAALVRAENRERLLRDMCILVVVVITVGFLSYRYRMHRKDAEISKRMSEIMLLTRELEVKDYNSSVFGQEIALKNNDIRKLSRALSEREAEIRTLNENSVDKSEKERLSAMIEELLRGRFSHLNTIINEYVEQQDGNYLAFYKNIEYELGKIRRPKNMMEIERLVDECKDGIISKIRVQLPGMRETDVTFIALTLAGLNARAIGLFMGTHPNSTYKRKKQLIKKISESEARDKDWFVEELIKC